MIQLPPGFRVGHWSDPAARTGCSVILCPASTVGGCDIRGNSPGSRELALLASEKSMQEVHAVLLTGGSAFGLAAADGVMRFLEEHDIGYATPWARVPIVPSAVIFDLNVGSSAVRPTADSGYTACSTAQASVESGRVGVGTGASVGKWMGLERSMPGGFGAAADRLGDVVVVAVAAVNAVGDVLDKQGGIVAGAKGMRNRWAADETHYRLERPPLTANNALGNTTLVALLTNAKLSKVDANRMAARGHDGMARAVKPVHTSHDGDIVFVLASGPVQCEYEPVAEIGADLTAEAIRAAVGPPANVTDPQ
ncbi:MAG: P1 family peptidase [Bacteroidetes bacterium]|nr:P1 family peptidase [Bacteroidota bacterium]